MIINDFVCLDEIISQVQKTVNDTELDRGFSIGWYRQMARKGMNAVSFSTFFLKLHKDYFDWNSDGRYLVTYPKGAFNLTGVYLFDGDEFSVDSSIKVDHMSNLNKYPKGKGYTRRRKQSGGTISGGSSYTVYGYNEQNGILHFTDECDSMDHLRIEFNGIAGDIGESPIIPRSLEDYVHDYICERFYRSEKNKSSYFRNLWADAKNDLDVSESKAKMFFNRMNTSQRRDLEERISRANF